MLIRDRLAREGKFLFRWRSYVPLLLLPLFIAALPEEERISQAVGPTAEHVVFYFSVLVSFIGLAIRMGDGRLRARRHVGTQHASASARSGSNTSGMYAIVRNPLYLGNFVAIVGVLICVKVWWLVAIFALRLLALHRAGDRGRGSVPGGQVRRRLSRLGWPRRRPSSRSSPTGWQPIESFSLPFLLRREYNGLLAVGASFFALELILDVFVAARAVHASGCRRISLGWCSVLRTLTPLSAPSALLKTRTHVLDA